MTISIEPGDPLRHSLPLPHERQSSGSMLASASPGPRRPSWHARKFSSGLARYGFCGLPISGFEAIRQFAFVWGQSTQLGCARLHCISCRGTRGRDYAMSSRHHTPIRLYSAEPSRRPSGRTPQPMGLRYQIGVRAEPALLPPRLLGDVRQDRRESTMRAHAAQPAQPVRDLLGLRPFHDRRPPRGLQPAREQRYRLQSRVAAPRRDPAHLRPTEVEEFCGDASKARERLGSEAWTTFRDLVRLMLEHDLAEAGNVPAEHSSVP
jgi:hypothetical protein